MESIVKFSLTVVVASLVALWGLIGAYDSVHQWTAAPFHCPPPRPGSGCVVLHSSSRGLSTGEGFALALGGLAAGTCLFLLAERIRPRQARPPARA